MNEIKQTLCNAIISSQTLASPTHSTIEKHDDKAIASFVKDVVDESKSTPTIVGVRVDENNTKISKILLAVKDSKDSYEQIVEYPLVEFATELSNAFEKKLTSTTLCFIADASGGLGTEMLGRIIASCGAGLVSLTSKKIRALMNFVSLPSFLFKPFLRCCKYDRNQRI